MNILYEKEKDMATWVNYREVKDRVTFTMVFEHYELLDDTETLKSGEMAIRCPFHDGAARTLKANDTKRGFQCFAAECGKKGNVIDFVSLMEDKPFRQAALLLQTWFMNAAPPAAAPEIQAPPQAASEAESVAPCPAPAASGRGYMREVDARLRDLLAADDPQALIKWVKEELLASYRRGIDKHKASLESDTR
jgi:hypothetical protein